MFVRQKHYATFKHPGDEEESVLSEDSRLVLLCEETSFRNPEGDEESGSAKCRRWLPVRCEASLPGELPQRRAGLLSQMSYSWLTPLMRLANRKSLTADDLYDTPPENGAARNADRFEAMWKDEVNSRGEQNASVARSLLRLVGSNLVLSSFCIVIYGACALMSPAFFMSELLRYADSQKADPLNGALLVFGMTAMEVLRSLFLALAWSLNCEAGIRASSGVMSSVYRKALRLDNVRELSPGEVINLFSNDGLRIFEAFNCGNFVIGPIVSGLAAAAMSFRLVGVWGLIGFAVFYCMVPLQAGLSKIGAKLRLKSLFFTDLRVKLTTEAITSIRLIKQYSWVDAFSKKIAAARDRERSHLEKVTFINGLLASVPSIIPSLASLATFTGLLLSTGNLTVLQAFTFIATLNGLRGTTTIMPMSVKAIADALLAARRIKTMLIMTERSSPCIDVNVKSKLLDTQAVVFSAASFSWPMQRVSSNRKAANNKAEDRKASGAFALSDVTLNIEKGKLYGVCGEVGSGKSSFVAAMAGLMPRTEGEMMTRGSIAYVAQQAWIMNASLRDNILFGLPMDEQRYNNVIACCGLAMDITLLPSGDLTEIGDRGVNLSGGQKQRISLARAVYSDRDIYLLDDPLSAVDAGIGKHIHEKCITGLLKGKTVVFITHQLQFLHGCDFVLFVRGGRIIKGVAHDGPISTSNGHTDSQHFKKDLASEPVKNRPALNQHEDGLFDEPQVCSVLSERPVSSPAATECRNGDLKYLQTGAVPLLKQEFLEKGRVSWEACNGYMQAAGFGFISLSFLLIVAMTFFTSISAWWLSFWLQNENAGVIVSQVLHGESLLATINADRICLIIYAMCVGAAAIFLVLKSVSYTKMSMRASSNFHNAILSKVLQSPMQLFDLTPTGQIINRFSKDIDEMDSMFPLSMESVTQSALSIVASLVLVSIGLPYASASIVPMFFVVIILYRKLSPGVRELKRLEHSARSRWFSHIATTVNGLSTIRAYEKEQPFIDRFYELTDAYCMTLGLYNNSMRWLAVRFDTIHIAITAIAGCLIAFLPTQLAAPAQAALAISNTLSLAGVFQHSIRLSIESECRFLSAERIWSYMKELKSEGDDFTTESISKSWPKNGEIIFEDVSLRYRADLPKVLKSICFNIRPREKIGIVGRTGSGKSSLGVALFRLAELDCGKVMIDGIDIRHVSLHELRSKLSIIPQDPVLFLGSLRYNLDPPGSYTDEDLNCSLRKCNLAISDRFSDGLDTHILEGGENLSVGERQLVCMARALLRRSKILMMDEATAAMDVATDKLLMNTIKEAFAECTVLIIAHRLNTVLQCDRVMVLDNGKIAEFEAPEKLLKNEASLFHQMLKNTESTSES